MTLLRWYWRSVKIPGMEHAMTKSDNQSPAYGILHVTVPPKGEN